MFKKMFSPVLVTVCLVGGLGCGGRQVSDDAIRRSQRLYEAATIEWPEKGDILAAIRHLSRALDENPQNGDAHYLLGTIRLSRGEWKEAEYHLGQAVALRSGDPSKLVEAQNSLGVVYLNTRRYDDAIALFTSASNEVLNSSPWLALGNLGWAYTEKGNYDDAIVALKRALFDQPQFCVGLYRLGVVYYRKGEYHQARDYLVDSLSVDAPGCDRLQEAFHMLGLTYLRLDDINDAVDAFEKCVEINPRTNTGTDCSKIRGAL